jgi:hypothetical protein
VLLHFFFFFFFVSLHRRSISRTFAVTKGGKRAQMCSPIRESVMFGIFVSRVIRSFFFLDNEEKLRLEEKQKTKKLTEENK